MKKTIIMLAFVLFLFSACGSIQSKSRSENSEDVVKKTDIKEVYTESEITEGTEKLPEYSDFIVPNGNTVLERFIPPKDYKRSVSEEGGFASFLRTYILEPDGTPVYYFDGKRKGGEGHAAVFSMEVGEEDLQQCADSIMRIYAEYLYKNGKYDRISFHFVDGFVCDFSHWSQGYRVKFSGDTPNWQKTADPDLGEESFKKYLRIVFAYSSTLSMEKEARSVLLSDIQAGDIFIKAGSPGHVVMVVDVCKNADGEKAFLLAQGFMPAQSFHVIKNPKHPNDPWYYEKEITYPFITQNYSFPEESLMRPVYLEE